MSEAARVSLRARGMQWFFGPVTAVRMQLFRWLLAWAHLLYALAWSVNADEWLTTTGFHITHELVPAQMPVPPLPPALLTPFLVVYLGSLVAVVFNWRPRLAATIAWMGLCYVSGADRLSMFTINKLFIASWLLVILAQEYTHHVEREAGEPSDADDESPASGEVFLVSAWPMRMLQATLLIQYLGAGLAKILHGDWLEYDDILFLSAQGVFMTDAAAWAAATLPLVVWAGLQHASLAFELLAPLLFTVPRLRFIAFVVGIGMHISIGLLMERLGYFSLQLVAFYVLFADDKWLAPLHRRLFAVDEKTAES